jgi:hypothetical protein
MPCDVGYLRLRCGDSVVSSKKSVLVATHMMTMNGLLKYLCALVNVQEMEARQSYGEDCDCSLCAGNIIHSSARRVYSALVKVATLEWVLFDKQKIENIFCFQFAVYFLKENK